MTAGPIFLPGPSAHTGLIDDLLLCDRDGTIIENRDAYVLSWSDVRFLPGAAAALAKATANGAAVVLVSNQSPVGRGLLTEAHCLRIHEGVTRSLVHAGVRVAGSYLCPHAPQDGCACRKPAPSMALRALEHFGVTADRCRFVGDSVEDMESAVRAGVPPVLVRTGRGTAHEPRVAGREDLAAVRVVDDLAAAVAGVAAVGGADGGVS